MPATVLNTTLDTVQDYITDARTLLQDVISPFRYDDPSLLTALNIALLEGRRLRPDLFVYTYGAHVPTFSVVDETEVDIEEQFRQGFVFGMCAHALARDQEDVEDQRSNAFMQVFTTVLTGFKPVPIAGGAPAQGGK
jgi:hypothetical protein